MGFKYSVHSSFINFYISLTENVFVIVLNCTCHLNRWKFFMVFFSNIWRMRREGISNNLRPCPRKWFPILTSWLIILRVALHKLRNWCSFDKNPKYQLLWVRYMVSIVDYIKNIASARQVGWDALFVVLVWMVRSVPNEILNISKPEGRREVRGQTECWLDAVDERWGY